MPDNANNIVEAWRPYVDGLTRAGNWQAVVADIEPKATGCGPVYEMGSPIDRPGESFAIADMREIAYAQPHYHTNGETEIYFVLAGHGLAVVGGREEQVGVGDVIITAPNTCHYLVPRNNLVVAVINNPPFNPANNIDVDLKQSNKSVGFAREQFEKLTGVA